MYRFLPFAVFPYRQMACDRQRGQKTPSTNLRFIFLRRYVRGYTADGVRLDPMQMNVSDTVCIFLLSLSMRE
ncbi:MAG: hypothetical protein EHM38_01755 [Geobacteraceae bacterium]|nr:MAG: hypothetical protein EHM38_01755 [Geobacteraceae bacterium]